MQMIHTNILNSKWCDQDICTIFENAYDSMSAEWVHRETSLLCQQKTGSPV